MAEFGVVVLAMQQHEHDTVTKMGDGPGWSWMCQQDRGKPRQRFATREEASRFLAEHRAHAAFDDAAGCLWEFEDGGREWLSHEFGDGGVCVNCFLRPETDDAEGGEVD